MRPYFFLSSSSAENSLKSFETSRSIKRSGYKFNTSPIAAKQRLQILKFIFVLAVNVSDRFRLYTGSVSQTVLYDRRQVVNYTVIRTVFHQNFLDVNRVWRVRKLWFANGVSNDPSLESTKASNAFQRTFPVDRRSSIIVLHTQSVLKIVTHYFFLIKFFHC